MLWRVFLQISASTREATKFHKAQTQAASHRGAPETAPITKARITPGETAIREIIINRNIERA